ncbi:MAG: carboxymuconolactone decarboxylase family protein [Planctomycetes bacterium]|nr:carboxymuconolactone decarboxylase family protein [Planctomycetota bacterium]
MSEERLPLLARAIAAVWRGDWSGFAAAATGLRCAHVPRSDAEETLLQAVLFCGFPRVVTAFEELNRVWPVATPPHGGALAEDQQAAAGDALFTAIYGRNDAAVRSMLRGCHGEFHDFVLQAAYGRILSRPGLSPLDRELLACAALTAQAQKRQFVAHARGALHFGATRDQLWHVLQAALDDGDAADQWLQLVRG